MLFESFDDGMRSKGIWQVKVRMRSQLLGGVVVVKKIPHGMVWPSWGSLVNVVR